MIGTGSRSLVAPLALAALTACTGERAADGDGRDDSAGSGDAGFEDVGGDDSAAADAEAGDSTDAGDPEGSGDDCRAGACSWAVPCAGPGCPTVEELRQVIPAENLPAGFVDQPANNNLDIARFDGRLFVAFRTAPSHFASAEAELVVLSSTDEVDWRFEGSFSVGRDLREPRLVVINGQLHLFFAILGTNPAAFEPGETRHSIYLGDGQWSEHENFYGEGFIPWRARVIEGRAYLIIYRGGENIYEADGEPVEVHWLTTDDGVSWRPVAGDDPVVLRGGTSETDFALLDDGSVVAVGRNEAGDELGFGSRICTAPADDPMDWTCAADPRKYDSPLVFRHAGQVWLVGRRNLTETGLYDVADPSLSMRDRVLANEWAYWNAPKRCSLWRIDPETRTVSFVLDLPSRGDTCFASVEPIDDQAVLLYNYSSPIDRQDWSWVQGQQRPTHIYRMILRFHEP
jgi:hypothetical protein